MTFFHMNNRRKPNLRQRLRFYKAAGGISPDDPEAMNYQQKKHDKKQEDKQKNEKATLKFWQKIMWWIRKK